MPDVGIEQIRVGKVEISTRTNHYQQTRIHNFALVPLEGLELTAQNLIFLALRVRPFLPHQLVRDPPGQVDRNDHIGQSEASSSSIVQRIGSEITDIVDDKVIPERVEGRRKREPEESAVHNNLNEEDEKEDDADSREDPSENLLDHPETDHNPDGDLLLDAGEVVVHEKDEELQIGDQSDHHKHYHVDVPVEPEVQQNFCMAQRREVQL